MKCGYQITWGNGCPGVGDRVGGMPLRETGGLSKGKTGAGTDQPATLKPGGWGR